MPDYRLYRLDGAGKIVSADWIAAETDEEAERFARKRSDVGHFELWERGRLVTRSTRDSR